MFNITVYSFIKRANSTKIVTEQDALNNTPMLCEIKWQGCGIINPVVRINFGLVKAPVNFNYAKIHEFKRYYFITDWTMEDALWTGYLKEDYLATWRDAIVSASAYIARAAAAWTKTMADDLYPCTGQVSIISEAIDFPWHAREGDYVIGVFGKPEILGTYFGAVQYFVMSATQLGVFVQKLMDNTNWLKIDWTKSEKFISEDLLKALFNPIQYIASCVWSPEVAADRGDPVNKIPIGFWAIEGVNARVLKVSDLIDSMVLNIPIPKHPQSGSYGSYLNLAPYTTYQVHVPPYGIIDIPADEIANSSKIAVEYVQDYATGKGRIMIGSQDRFVQIVNCDLGVNVAISQLTQQPLQATQALAGTVANYAKYNTQQASFWEQVWTSPVSRGAESQQNYTELIYNQSKGLGDMLNALSPTIQSSGANGTLAPYYTGENFIRISGKFIMVADRDDEHQGRPVGKVMRIGDLDGFVKCEAVSIAIEGNYVEQQAVNAHLNGGFYME